MKLGASQKPLSCCPPRGFLSRRLYSPHFSPSLGATYPRLRGAEKVPKIVGNQQEVGGLGFEPRCPAPLSHGASSVPWENTALPGVGGGQCRSPTESIWPWTPGLTQPVLCPSHPTPRRPASEAQPRAHICFVQLEPNRGRTACAPWGETLPPHLCRPTARWAQNSGFSLDLL